MEFKEKQAIYLQIGDYLCENILRRKWREGDKIPSVRDMSVSIEVNPNTVMRAYSYLQDRGIIFNKRGIGYFVDGNAYKRTRDLKRKNFTSRELPSLFKTMDLLGITFDDLRELYKTDIERRRSGNKTGN